MLKQTRLLMALPLAILLVTSCGWGSNWDQEQKNSREVASHNCMGFAKKLGADFVDFQSDSTISKKCPEGDGWASGKAMATGGEIIALIKGQTDGSGKGTNGCMLEEEFLTKAYAQQEGECVGGGVLDPAKLK